MVMSSCKICNDNEKIEKDIEEIKTKFESLVGLLEKFY